MGIKKIKNGQAMIEFLIGIIGIIVLFFGLLQIGMLSRGQNDAYMNARKEAGELAMMGATISTPDFIKDILDGSDGSSYTVDDITTIGSIVEFKNNIVEPSALSSDWGYIDRIPGNRFSAIRVSGVPTYEFQMVEGSESRTVPILMPIQHLVYAADEINITHSVWLPYLGGIY